MPDGKRTRHRIDTHLNRQRLGQIKPEIHKHLGDIKYTLEGARAGIGGVVRQAFQNIVPTLITGNLIPLRDDRAHRPSAGCVNIQVQINLPVHRRNRDRFPIFGSRPVVGGVVCIFLKGQASVRVDGNIHIRTRIIKVSRTFRVLPLILAHIQHSFRLQIGGIQGTFFLDFQSSQGHKQLLVGTGNLLQGCIRIFRYSSCLFQHYREFLKGFRHVIISIQALAFLDQFLKGGQVHRFRSFGGLFRSRRSFKLLGSGHHGTVIGGNHSRPCFRVAVIGGFRFRAGRCRHIGNLVTQQGGGEALGRNHTVILFKVHRNGKLIADTKGIGPACNRGEGLGLHLIAIKGHGTDITVAVTAGHIADIVLVASVEIRIFQLHELVVRQDFIENAVVANLLFQRDGTVVMAAQQHLNIFVGNDNLVVNHFRTGRGIPSASGGFQILVSSQNRVAVAIALQHIVGPRNRFRSTFHAVAQIQHHKINVAHRDQIIVRGVIIQTAAKPRFGAIAVRAEILIVQGINCTGIVAGVMVTGNNTIGHACLFHQLDSFVRNFPLLLSIGGRRRIVHNITGGDGVCRTARQIFLTDILVHLLIESVQIFKNGIVLRIGAPQHGVAAVTHIVHYRHSADLTILGVIGHFYRSGENSAANNDIQSIPLVFGIIISLKSKALSVNGGTFIAQADLTAGCTAHIDIKRMVRHSGSGRGLHLFAAIGHLPSIPFGEGLFGSGLFLHGIHTAHGTIGSGVIQRIRLIERNRGIVGTAHLQRQRSVFRLHVAVFRHSLIADVEIQVLEYLVACLVLHLKYQRLNAVLQVFQLVSEGSLFAQGLTLQPDIGGRQASSGIGDIHFQLEAVFHRLIIGEVGGDNRILIVENHLRGCYAGIARIQLNGVFSAGIRRGIQIKHRLGTGFFVVQHEVHLERDIEAGIGVSGPGVI